MLLYSVLALHPLHEIFSWLSLFIHLCISCDMVSLCICYWSLDRFCRLTRLSLPVSSVCLRFGQCVLKLWQTNNKTEELMLNLEKYSVWPSACRQIDQKKMYSEFEFCCINWKMTMNFIKKKRNVPFLKVKFWNNTWFGHDTYFQFMV